MLRPAICYRDEICNFARDYFYSSDMMYYMGCNASDVFRISENCGEGEYEWAVVGEEDHLIGYITYRIDFYSSCVYNFGAFSFDRGNPIMGKDLYALFENLLGKYHRVEFKAISGNPAIKAYDNLLKKHQNTGKKHVLRDVFKDIDGNYHDSYVYEFINLQF